jgi:hypothetical protein
MSFLTGSSSKVYDIPVTLQSSLNAGQTAASNALSGGLTSGNLQSIISALYPTYNRQVSAPVSPATSGAVEALTGAIPGAASAATGIGGTQQTGLNTLQRILTSSPSDAAGYYQSNVYNPLTSKFVGTSLGDILSATGGVGNRSGQQGTALGTALEDFGTTLASTKGTLDYNTQLATASNILSALGISPSVTAAPTTDLTTIAGLGTTAQKQAQTNLAQQFALYQQGQTNTTNMLQALVDYLKVQTTTPATQTATTQASSGLLSSLIPAAGGAATGAAVASALA